MDWTILIVLVGLWLVSPIVLLIALIVSRRQLADVRRQLAAWKQQAINEPPRLPPWQSVELESPAIPDIAPAFCPSSQQEAGATTRSQPVPLPLESVPISRPIPPSPTLPPLRTEPTPSVESSLKRGTTAPLATDWQPPADWQPAEPGPLERALQMMSGWPALIAPFLVQNIGWFIGGFCFVAGALFLVANTTGFINALVVFASLLAATGFLIWAGYQFRRARPELAVASGVLLTLGLMLGPLDLAVAMRLFNASEGKTLWLALSALLAMLTLGAFAWAARLVSALIDRALPGRYASLLTAIAGMQLFAPLAVVLPDWPVLAVFHIVLLGLLSDGLRRFADEWLRQIFLDRRWTSYFAAGMLVYASVVSFVHLTWIWPEPLPTGYSGPFMMALCLLLFPVDAALKEWVHKYAFLSRFSFTLYGLSVVAVAMAAPATPAAILTLALGAGLYSWMTWRYLTLPPLYLLFGCMTGLYGYGILQWLPPAWHLLASLPGLLALLLLSRWASLRNSSPLGEQRWSRGAGSQAIAWQCLLTFGLLLAGLTIWSLFWATPGEIGFATATAAVVLGHGATRWALSLSDVDSKWTAYVDTGIAVLAATAVAYAPNWSPFSWPMQTALGWLMLAALWTGLGLHDARQSPVRRLVWINSALLAIVSALVLAGVNLWPTWLGRLEPLLLLALAGGLLLWLSLGLRQRFLFYGVLLLAVAIGVLVKLGYFPAPGVGLVEFILVLALWSFLWWIDWRMEIRERLLTEVGDAESGRETHPAAMIRVPLEQTMSLLWTVGLVHLGSRLLEGNPSPTWPGIAGLAAISGLLLIGRLHWFYGVALPMLLGLTGWLAGLAQWGVGLPGLAAASVGYALLVWRLSVTALDQPLIWRLARLVYFSVPGGVGGRRRVEESLHGCAMLVATVPVAVSLSLGLLGNAAPQLWPALGVSLLLFVLTGVRYRTATHVGAILITLTLGVWLASAWLKPPALFILGQPLVNVGLSFVMLLAAVGLASEHPASFAYWRRPLWMVGGFLYGLALAGAVLGLLAGVSGLPVLLALLCVTLFPLTRPLANAADWRGLGLVLLTSVLVWNVAGQAGFAVWDEAGLIFGWGYALWGISNLLLPQWNARFPDWAVTVNFWPLLGLVVVVFGTWTGLVVGEPSLAVLLAGLALYLFLLLRNTVWFGMAWLGLAALMASSLAAADDLGVPIVWLPLGLALWHGALLAMWRYVARLARLQTALEFWLALLPLMSIGLLFGVAANGMVWSITLVVLAATTLMLGWQRAERFWLKTGLWLALTSSYAFWLWNVPFTWMTPVTLLPWYALQSLAVWLGLKGAHRRLVLKLGARDSWGDEESFGRWLEVERTLDKMASWCLLATLLWLGLHIASVTAWQLGWDVWPWHFGMPTDGLATGASLTLLLGWTGRGVWRHRDEPNRIYAVVLLLSLLVGYGRLVMLGLAPLTPWDTAGLLAAGGIAFVLHQFSGLQPFYRLALWLPLLALATAPWQLASPWMGGTLLAVGVLYLSLAGTLRNPLPLYLGVLALNGAIYLWAPLWAQRYGLWQFYLIPATVSVLLLLHLHRRELRPKVLNGTRLAALSALYAGAGLDVFLQPELWVFMLALALALTGIVIGIALRIRAFLYAGVAFLILNISGQVLRLYPEQGMSRALILLGLGATITAGMVLFNLKREAILQRIRIARADLAEWE